MKKLLIAALLPLAACNAEHPTNIPPAPTTPIECPAGTTNPDCVWPDGRPK